VWKVKVPQRCIVFLWLALHDRLLTNVNRAKRGLTISPFCPLCNLEYEDIDHLLRRYPEVMKIWQWLSSNGMGVMDANMEFQKWIKRNVLGKDMQETWVTKFMITIWYI